MWDPFRGFDIGIVIISGLVYSKDRRSVWLGIIIIVVLIIVMETVMRDLLALRFWVLVLEVLPPMLLLICLLEVSGGMKLFLDVWSIVFVERCCELNFVFLIADGNGIAGGPLVEYERRIAAGELLDGDACQVFLNLLNCSIKLLNALVGSGSN